MMRALGCTTNWEEMRVLDAGLGLEAGVGEVGEIMDLEMGL